MDSNGKTVRFGPFEVDLQAGELRKHGSRLKLQEQPFQVLSALLERPGEVVTRDELVRRLWPDGTFTDFDRGLNAAVTRLRQTLSDSAEAPRYVETVARRGYRLIAPVESESTVQSALDQIPNQPVAPRGRMVWLWASLAVVLSVMAAAGLWWRYRQETPKSAAPLTLLPLTTEPGFAACPSFSPDGNQVAYEWDQDKREPRIYIKLVGPGEPVRLTTGSTAESCPVWSPDGKFVAFTRALSGKSRGLFLVPALGGAEYKLAEFATPREYFPQFRPRLITWTHDSKQLIVGIPDSTGFSGLYIVAVTSGVKTKLRIPASDGTFWDRDPALSPDDRTLAFIREGGYGASDLYLLKLTKELGAEGELRQLTSEARFGRFAQTPAWTRDGSEIVYCSNRDGTPRLWRIGIQPGAAPRQVESVGPDTFFPTLSQGGKLVYTHAFQDSNIWRQELPSQSGPLPAPVRLIASTAQDFNAQYSPDGTRIAFQSDRSGNHEIWTCGTDGGRCQQLTSFKGPVTGTPRWSPGGKKIAFDSAAAGHFDIYVIDAEGGEPRRMTEDPTGAIIPSWSRDQKWIYFSSQRTGTYEIWKVPAAGGNAIQVTRHGGFTAFESFDGTKLYYTKDEAASTLWSGDPTSGTEIAVAEHVMKRGFVPTQDRLYYLRQEAEPNSASLCALILASSQSVLIAPMAKNLQLGLSTPPDGKSLIYSQVDQERSNLMFADFPR